MLPHLFQPSQKHLMTGWSHFLYPLYNYVNLVWGIIIDSTCVYNAALPIIISSVCQNVSVLRRKCLFVVAVDV